MKKIGVIIGRFQTHDVHEGHLALIDYVKHHHDNVVIMLGVRQAPANKRYPLDYPTREIMIRGLVPGAMIVPIVDIPDNKAWSSNVDSFIDMLFPACSATLYGGRDSFIEHYLGKHKTKELDFVIDKEGYSATKLRAKVSSNPKNSSDFRAGVIYSIENLLPRNFLTVDIAMVNRDNVLMGKKFHDNAWRFPGGFVDFSDESIESAAKRELFEETGMTCENGLDYLGSFAVNDWRKTEDTRIITCLFETAYTYGSPVASDDLCEVSWIPIGSSDVTECHKPLMERLNAKFNS